MFRCMMLTNWSSLPMLATSFLATVIISFRTVSLRWMSPMGYPVPSPFLRKRQTFMASSPSRCCMPGWKKMLRSWVGSL